MSLDALATASLERYTDEIKANKPKIVIERPLQIKRSYSNNNPNHLPFIRKTQSDIGSFGIMHATSNNQSCVNQKPTWHHELKPSDINLVKSKIKQAYLDQVPENDLNSETILSLINLYVAVENDFLMTHSPSRLDYVKSGIQYYKKVLRFKNKLMEDKRNKNIISDEKIKPNSEVETEKESDSDCLEENEEDKPQTNESDSVESNGTSIVNNQSSDFDEPESKKRKVGAISIDNMA